MRYVPRRSIVEIEVAGEVLCDDGDAVGGLEEEEGGLEARYAGAGVVGQEGLVMYCVWSLGFGGEGGGVVPYYYDVGFLHDGVRR